MMSLRDRIPVCPHATKSDLDISLILMLVRLEKLIGFELDYSSGFRCPECNLRAGGVKNSAHIRGLAVDIRCHTSHERFEIDNAAVSIGVRRRGIGKKIVHLDVASSLPQDVLFLY